MAKPMGVRVRSLIGVDDWDAFSNDIQSKVLATLKSFGVI
jgi:hypothetical protein